MNQRHLRQGENENRDREPRLTQVTTVQPSRRRSKPPLRREPWTLAEATMVLVLSASTVLNALGHRYRQISERRKRPDVRPPNAHHERHVDRLTIHSAPTISQFQK
jgi:hypothetical protein